MCGDKSKGGVQGVRQEKGHDQRQGSVHRYQWQRELVGGYGEREGCSGDEYTEGAEGKRCAMRGRVKRGVMTKEEAEERKEGWEWWMHRSGGGGQFLFGGRGAWWRQ